MSRDKMSKDKMSVENTSTEKRFTAKKILPVKKQNVHRLIANDKISANKTSIFKI